jgi:hypothetical protein
MKKIIVFIKPCYKYSYSKIDLRGKILILRNTNELYFYHKDKRYLTNHNDLNCWFIQEDQYIIITSKNRSIIKQYLKNKKHD